MKLIKNALIGLCCLMVIGCAKTTTISEIRTNGTWERTIKLSVSKGMDEEPLKIDKYFTAPAGSQWKTSEKMEKDTLVLTAVRQMKIGDEPVSDIVIREKDGIKLKNSVSVKEIAPGRYEYVETFTWTGAKKDNGDEMTKKMAEELKKILPASVEDPLLNKVAADVGKQLWKFIWGPGDPMLLTILTNADYASHKVSLKMSQILDAVFVKHLDDLMTVAERRAAIRKFVESIKSEELMKKPDEQSAPSPDGGDGDLIPMFAKVKFPGKIIESDGEVDPISGEVFWALYPEAAQMGVVRIHAICDTNP